MRSVCVIRTRIPLAPRGPDVTVYIVLNDYGSLGRAFVETDAAKADEATVIENILTGEYSCPLSVVAFNTVEGWARDVTEDIAREVMRRGENEKSEVGNFWKGCSEPTCRCWTEHGGTRHSR